MAATKTLSVQMADNPLKKSNISNVITKNLLLFFLVGYLIVHQGLIATILHNCREVHKLSSGLISITQLQ